MGVGVGAFVGVGDEVGNNVGVRVGRAVGVAVSGGVIVAAEAAVPVGGTVVAVGAQADAKARARRTKRLWCLIRPASTRI